MKMLAADSQFKNDCAQLRLHLLPSVLRNAGSVELEDESTFLLLAPASSSARGTSEA